jgi:peptidoglycan hydrolase-like protein with peptidoglycan-binding domain
LALQSRLFVGDAALEAAAASDAAHIAQGSSGPHVRKIQTGLNLVDGASLNADGSYGHLTAAAVLNYKRARAIINTARQTEADDIVGRMTVAALDAELVDAESPKGPIRIKPVFTAAGGTLAEAAQGARPGRLRAQRFPGYSRQPRPFITGLRAAPRRVDALHSHRRRELHCRHPGPWRCAGQ